MKTEVGIYKRKQESEKERKHAFDQEKGYILCISIILPPPLSTKSFFFNTKEL